VARSRSTIAFGEQDDPRFTEWMQTSRAVFEKNHLIAYLRVESIENKGRVGECRYDRYPELECVQGPSGATYARKKLKFIEPEGFIPGSATAS
jgi:hypothetical protein